MFKTLIFTKLRPDRSQNNQLAMRRIFWCVLLLSVSLGLRAQTDIPILSQLELERAPAGQVSKYWVNLLSGSQSLPILVPVLVAKGVEDGPVVGLTAAIHGNELNGIPIIQEVFRQIDPANLKGTVVGVPGLNAVSLQLDVRRFIDEEDLNRNFPGKANGNNSQQYVYWAFDKIVRHFDYLVDLHTASFGRINSLYVRADLTDSTIARMAYWQDADIILQDRGMPSAGQVVAASRTMRAEAVLHGIPAITIEYGDPQVYQSDMTGRGVWGILNLLAGLGLTAGSPQAPPQPAIVCQRSYWIYTDAGGLLEVPVELRQRLQAGELIGLLRNPFGELITEYRAPEAGIVIGKSTNPNNMQGGRIIHLGILR